MRFRRPSGAGFVSLSPNIPAGGAHPTIPAGGAPLQQAAAAKAQFRPLADDQMVVHDDGQGHQGRDDGLGHRDVRLTGRWIAGGVIVHQYDGRGAQFQRPAGDLTWVDGDVIDGAPGLRLIRSMLRRKTR